MVYFNPDKTGWCNPFNHPRLYSLLSKAPTLPSGPWRNDFDSIFQKHGGLPATFLLGPGKFAGASCQIPKGNPTYSNVKISLGICLNTFPPSNSHPIFRRGSQPLTFTCQDCIRGSIAKNMISQMVVFHGDGSHG